MARPRAQDHLDLLRDAALEDRLLLFLGAGVSAGAAEGKRLPDAKRLASMLARRFGLPRAWRDEPLDRVSELIEIRQGRAALVEALSACLGGEIEPTPTHRLVAKLACQTLVTTNYDLLMEEALRQEGRAFSTISSQADLARIGAREVDLFKIHGSLSAQADDFIVTQRDYYDRFLLGSRFIVDVLRASLGTHVCLFVGYSLRDVNLLYLFFDIAKKLGAETVRGRFFAIQRDANPVDQLLWENRGLKILVADQVRILDELLERIELRGLQRRNGSLVTTPQAHIGKVPLSLLRELERKNGPHAQRFVLLSERKMSLHRAAAGDWLEVRRARPRGPKAELARVFATPQGERATLLLPLVMRNLLGMDLDLETPATRPELRLRRVVPLPLPHLAVRPSDMIVRIPMERGDSAEPRGVAPRIGIRALEFERLGLTEGEEAVLSFRGRRKGQIVVRASLLRNNPGRAVLALDAELWERILGGSSAPFTLRVSRRPSEEPSG